MSAQTLLDRENQMCNERATADSGTLSKDDFTETCGRYYDSISEIANLTAVDIDGVAAKLRTLEFVLEAWGTDTEWHMPIVRSAREAAERLSKGGAA